MGLTLGESIALGTDVSETVQPCVGMADGARINPDRTIQG